MNVNYFKQFWKSSLMVIMLCFGLTSWGQVSITNLPQTETQNFNSLTNGTWTNNSTLPGWYARTTNTSSITSYGANTGTSTAAGLYAYGIAGTNPLSDRALGFATSNGFTGSASSGKNLMGWRFKNNSGQIITSVTIVWTGEQWRKENTNVQSLILSYQVNNSDITDLNSGIWVTTDSQFESQNNTSGAAALDGNASANRVVGITKIIEIEIGIGEEIVFRWEDLNDSGNDHHLAIDDVSITFDTSLLTYTVTYNGNGADGDAPVDGDSPYNHGSNVTVLGQGTLTLTDHSFLGWNTQADGLGTFYAENAEITNITSDITLYAQWLDDSLDPQTITFDPLSAVTYGDAAFELTATSDSGLTVSYASSNENVATISGNTVTIVGAGTADITASQLGNSEYQPATPVVQTLTVNPKNLTIADVIVLDKPYDGTTAAEIDISVAWLVGKIAEDDISFAIEMVTGEFASVDVGTGIEVTLTSEFTLFGTDAANYTLTQPDLTGNILKADQTVTLSDLNAYLGGEAIDLPTVTEQGIAIEYISDNESVATVEGNVLTIVGLGTTEIFAGNSGSSNYNAFTGGFEITVTEAPQQYAGVGVFEKITSLEDLTDGYYVMVYEVANHAMTNTGTSYLNVTNVTISDNQITNPPLSIVWKIETTSENTTIYNEEVEQYVSATANSTSLGLNINPINWETTASGGLFTFRNKTSGTNNRKIGYNTTANPRRFAHYAGSANEPVTLTLYKLTPPSTDPLFTVSATELTGLDYVAGNGPSVFQSFTVSGANLDGSAIVVTAPANFEVSTDDVAFDSSLNLSSTEGTLAATMVYVRLAAGLTADNYSGNITISGGDAPNVTVAVSGEVTPLAPVTTPTIDVTGIANGTDTYWNTAEITLATTTPGATIYYTTDDSEPTTASTEYTVAFDVTATTTIKAFAVADGLDDSEVATKIITITEPATATTPYDETFTNTLGDWTNHKLFGNPGFNGWVTSAQGVTVNGYSQGNTQAWLISPKFNAGANGLLLSFDYASQYQGNNLEIRISNNYSGYGNPGDATWTTVTTITENASSALVSSSLTEYLISTSGNTHIALVYADNSSWAMWRVSNLIINSVTPCDEENLTAGTTIASTPEVTSGGSVNLSLTGTSTGAGLSYQWQSSSNGTDWSDIDGATAATYNATNITAATYFRAKVTCGDITEESTAVQVTLTYCLPTYSSGGANDKITNVTLGDLNNSATGATTAPYYTFYDSVTIPDITTGETIEVSVTFGSDSNQHSAIWIDFNQNKIFEASEGFIGTNPGSGGTYMYEIPVPVDAVLGQTRMRVRGGDDSALTTSQACGASNSPWGETEDYTVNILPAAIVWTTDNEWSNETGPTITDDVIIEGDNYVVTGNVAAKTLTVANGGKITIPENAALTVEGKITNNGDFTVENDGILYQNNFTGANEGNITVERDANPMKRLDYTLWSSPVSGMPLNQFSNISNNGGTGTIWNRVYELGATAWTSIWTSYNEAIADTDTFAAAKGYLYRAFNSYDAVNTTIFTGEFTGVPNNGNYSINTPNAFDAIGNPYPSPINANDFINETAGVGAVYFWTNVNSSNGTEYVHNNWASYTLIGGAGVTEGSEGETEYFTPDGTIQPGQGFVVYTEETTSSVLFNNAMRINSNSQFFRAMATERNRFWLNLSNEEVTFNQILVGYMDNATQGVDTGIDGKMFAYEGNALYSIIDNNEDMFVIQGRALPFTASDVVALGFRAVNAGSFTISLDNVDGLFAEGNTTIYLKDNFTQTQHNLNSGAYSFVSEEGIFDTRFEVVYQTTMSVENPVANNANWVVYSQENGFQVQTQGFELKTVQVFDLLGRTIYTANAQGTVHQIPALGADSVYIVKVTTTDNVVLSKKVK